jgi:hypothetical protein
MVQETTDRSAWLSRLLVLAAAVALGWQLMLPPVVGVADNGDFGKLIGRFGLGSGQTFEYADTTFFFSDRYRYHSGFNSSELLPIAPAVALARGGSLDLRTIGAIHVALFLLAVLLFVPLAGWMLAALALLLFCDFLYVGYFNSFYMDVAALLFTILAAVFYLRAMRECRPADSIALLISAILATTSKPHYVFLGTWFAVLFWVARGILCAGRKAVAAAAAAVLILTAWASFRFLAPEDYAAKGCFTVIFTQILPHSADPDSALRDLGLDSSYRKWSGLQAYSPGSPVDAAAFYQPFLEKTSYRKIARFYLTHPGDAWRAFRAALDEAGRFRSPLGNFDSQSGRLARRAVRILLVGEPYQAAAVPSSRRAPVFRVRRPLAGHPDPAPPRAPHAACRRLTRSRHSDPDGRDHPGRFSAGRRLRPTPPPARLLRAIRHAAARRDLPGLKCSQRPIVRGTV